MRFTIIDITLLIAIIGLGFGWTKCLVRLEQISPQSGWTTELQEVDGEDKTVWVNETVIEMPDGRVYRPPYTGLYFHPTYVHLVIIIVASVVVTVLSAWRAVVVWKDAKVLIKLLAGVIIIVMLILLFYPTIQAAR